MRMSEKVRIAADPEDEHLPFTHLLPLVQALVDHGNPLALPGPKGGLFSPSQGGWVAYLSHRIDWAWVQDTFDLPDLVRYNPKADEIFDHKNWISILGSNDER
jgi:hypothetical protein